MATAATATDDNSGITFTICTKDGLCITVDTRSVDQFDAPGVLNQHRDYTIPENADYGVLT